MPTVGALCSPPLCILQEAALSACLLPGACTAGKPMQTPRQGCVQQDWVQ